MILSNKPGLIDCGITNWNCTSFTARQMAILALLCSTALIGCSFSSSSSQQNTADASAQDTTTDTKTQLKSKVSRVPLRIWVVGNMQQSDVLLRQWLADDEQPAEIRVLAVEELLGAEQSGTGAAEADVMIYPSRLLGEVIRRQWVVKLPQTLLASNIENGDPGGLAGLDNGIKLRTAPALISACSYDGYQFGLPLGFATISLIGSESTSAEQLSHQALFEELTSNIASGQDGPLEVTADDIDCEALVDRFLSIAFGVTQVNSKYGVLFDVRTMASRLSQPEFVFAAELLTKLARQEDGVRSVVGSHSEAWRWANQTNLEGFALVSASELNSEVRTLDRVKLIRLIDTKAWNTGAGMIASITARCRQSAQSVRFLEWVSRAKTISSFESNMLGTVSLSDSAVRAADRVNQHTFLGLNDYNVSCEPRLPLTHEYRRALAAELISIVSGRSSIADGLDAACAAWDKLTGDNTKSQQREYERSLGMTL